MPSEKIVKLYVFGHQNAARLIIVEAESNFTQSVWQLESRDGSILIAVPANVVYI